MAMTSARRLLTRNGRRELPPTQLEGASILRLIRARSSRRPTIMVVEDDVSAARALADALEFAGYRVRSVATGRQACAMQPRLRPDLIILDLMLPDTDGLVLTTTLKAMTDAPIVIVSARHGEIDRALGLRLGAADFVSKPFDLDDFQARIAALVPARKRRGGHRTATRGVITSHEPRRGGIQSPPPAGP